LDGVRGRPGTTERAGAAFGARPVPGFRGAIALAAATWSAASASRRSREETIGHGRSLAPIISPVAGDQIRA
jgi:hypothetical protein